MDSILENKEAFAPVDKNEVLLAIAEKSWESVHNRIILIKVTIFISLPKNQDICAMD